MLSEVISVMQAVRGVNYVDVDALGGIDVKAGTSPANIADIVENIVSPPESLTVKLATLDSDGISSAQIAFLSPDIPTLLTLHEIKGGDSHA